jgi:hypothetical protein
MISPVNWSSRNVRRALALLSLVFGASACGNSDNPGPTSESPVPVDAPSTPSDSSATPTDSMVPSSDSTFPDTAGLSNPGHLAFAGIPFGPAGMRSNYFTSLYRATKQGLDPQFLMDELRIAKSKGGRLALEMASKGDERIQNADGTFSYAKWKALVDGYKAYNFNSYITDGTLIGHFLVDEPENVKKWGGKPIPYTTIEAMAKYSKQLWPGLTTFVRAPPKWLAQASINFTYLDAGWVQYGYWKGNATQWIAAEVAAAKAKRIGLMAGMNVLDGGNGSSGIRGWLSNRWAMSAAEIKNYGTAILAQPYVCGFIAWTYLYQGADYFNRTTVKSSMTTLSNLAKSHAQTSCRQ